MLSLLFISGIASIHIVSEFFITHVVNTKHTPNRKSSVNPKKPNNRVRTNTVRQKRPRTVYLIFSIGDRLFIV